MSGGSLNYAYLHVQDAADEVKGWARTKLHERFALHLKDVSEALHDLEWELSCDYGEGDADDAIKKVLGDK
jgi:hypothetical protein